MGAAGQAALALVVGARRFDPLGRLLMWHALRRPRVCTPKERSARDSREPGDASPPLLHLSPSTCSDGFCCSAVTVHGELLTPFARMFHNRVVLFEATVPGEPEGTTFSCCEHLVAVLSPSSRVSGGVELAMRCGAYDERPRECRLYPEACVEADVTVEGTLLRERVVREKGPCLYNEFLAPRRYQVATTSFPWDAAWLLSVKAVHEGWGTVRVADEDRSHVVRALEAGTRIGLEGESYYRFPVDRVRSVCWRSSEHLVIRSLAGAWAEYAPTLARKAELAWGPGWRRHVARALLAERQTR